MIRLYVSRSSIDRPVSFRQVSINQTSRSPEMFLVIVPFLEGRLLKILVEDNSIDQEGIGENLINTRRVDRVENFYYLKRVIEYFFFRDFVTFQDPRSIDQFREEILWGHVNKRFIGVRCTIVQVWRMMDEGSAYTKSREIDRRSGRRRTDFFQSSSKFPRLKHPAQ